MTKDPKEFARMMAGLRAAAESVRRSGELAAAASRALVVSLGSEHPWAWGEADEQRWAALIEEAAALGPHSRREAEWAEMDARSFRKAAVAGTDPRALCVPPCAPLPRPMFPANDDGAGVPHLLAHDGGLLPWSPRKAWRNR
jgi:hypothetical protein